MIDFSDLSDDQLVTLIRAACLEAVKRGAGVAGAARDAYVTEAERARVIHEVSAHEAERLRRMEEERIAREAAEKLRQASDRAKATEAAAKEADLWARRRGIALAFEESSYDPSGDQVVVWRSPSHEKRVFLQQKRFGGATYATLYVTGNAKHAPDTVAYRSGFTATQKADIGAILRAVAAEWDSIKVDIDEALAWKGAAVRLRDYPAPVPSTVPNAGEAAA